MFLRGTTLGQPDLQDRVHGLLNPVRRSRRTEVVLRLFQELERLCGFPPAAFKDLPSSSDTSPAVCRASTLRSA